MRICDVSKIPLQKKKKKKKNRLLKVDLYHFIPVLGILVFVTMPPQLVQGADPSAFTTSLCWTEQTTADNSETSPSVFSDY